MGRAAKDIDVERFAEVDFWVYPLINCVIVNVPACIAP